MSSTPVILKDAEMTGQFQLAIVLESDHDGDTIRLWDIVCLDDGAQLRDRTIVNVINKKKSMCKRYCNFL